MKKKSMILVLTLVLVFGMVQIASAVGTGWKNGPRALSSDNWVNLADTLKLTDQQISKMKEVQQNSYKQSRDLRVKLQDTMFELKQMQLEKNPDKAKVEAKIKEVNDLRNKLYNIRQQSRQQCQSILTQEQLAQMAKLRSGCKTCPKAGGGYGQGNAR